MLDADPEVCFGRAGLNRVPESEAPPRRVCILTLDDS
jgi:hypothetical protein